MESTKNIQDFLAAPSVELLDLCSREEVVELAAHYEVDVGDKRMTNNMKIILIERLNLKQEDGAASSSGTAAATFDSSGGLSFEERRQLLFLEIEIKQNEVKKLELEEQVRRLAIDGGAGQGHARSFDISGNLKLVPRFSERDPDTFFSLFERVADSRRWSDAERTLLLQCTLTGRAQEVYSALTVAESGVYTSVKKAVLKAYELVPEAYR